MRFTPCGHTHSTYPPCGDGGGRGNREMRYSGRSEYSKHGSTRQPTHRQLLRQPGGAVRLVSRFAAIGPCSGPANWRIRGGARSGLKAAHQVERDGVLGRGNL